MTPLQKRILLALAFVIALSRLLAVAHTLFDWDEALFTLGIREYDVVNHHPHPPGYPLFVGAAKVVHFFGVEEFRALQTIVVLGAMLLFPVLYWLGREIGFGFTTAAAGAAIFAFFPNVWVYGGTGFSDVPAAALVLAACALLLRGRTDRRAYLAGAIVLGISCGMRPACLVIAAVPALVATWHRIRARDFLPVAGAIVLGGAIVAGSYLGAAWATGSVQGYLDAVRGQSRWVREVDSWRNPGRPPLHEVAKQFFLMPVQQKAQMHGIALLAFFSLGVAAVRRRPAPLFTFAIFAPFAVVAWLNLDVEAAGRYAIPYLAGYALLVADALSIIGRRRVIAQSVLAAMVVTIFAVWTWPALTLQRNSDPPPVGALRWIQRNVPRETLVYIHGGVGPQADYVVPDRQTFWEQPEQISALAGDAWVVDLRVTPGAHNFVWPRSNPLWKILRRRNFETSVSQVASFIQFGSEWYSEEGSGMSAFRWMPGSATATLPALRGNGRLHLKVYVPIDTLPAHPEIEVVMNGAVVERFAGSQAVIEKNWIVPSRKGAVNELRITTSGTVNPAKLGGSSDTRDLGLRVDGLSWTPVR
jgi:4-amino-4-deoxy-L-arabinose transferase-like glycosyltransferase